MICSLLNCLCYRDEFFVAQQHTQSDGQIENRALLLMSVGANYRMEIKTCVLQVLAARNGKTIFNTARECCRRHHSDTNCVTQRATFRSVARVRWTKRSLAPGKRGWRRE